MKQRVRRILRLVMPMVWLLVFCHLHSSWAGLPIIARDYGEALATTTRCVLLAAPVFFGALFGLMAAAGEGGGLLMGLAYGVFGFAIVFCDLYTFEPPIPTWLATAEAALVLAAFVVPGYLRACDLLRVTIRSL